MPRAKSNPALGIQAAQSTPRVVNGLPEEVLTLGEAAAYLRLPEEDVRVEN